MDFFVVFRNITKQQTTMPTITNTEKPTFIKTLTDLGISEVVAMAAWVAKNDEATAKAIAIEREATEKEAGIDKKRLVVAKKQKEIEALNGEISAFETENAKYYAVVKKSGGGAKPPSQQKYAKKLRADKRKAKIAAGGGVRCKCGKVFMKKNSFYKKCMEKCKGNTLSPSAPHLDDAEINGETILL